MEEKKPSKIRNKIRLALYRITPISKRIHYDEIAKIITLFDAEREFDMMIRSDVHKLALMIRETKQPKEEKIPKNGHGMYE